MSSGTKNIIILNGSPRPKGNTAAIIDLFQNAVIEQKHTIKKYDLYKLNMRGCAHCDACTKIIDAPGCVLKDDFTAILNELVQADVIVIASPVYCWSVSGCMSTALDRFYAFGSLGKFLLAHKKVIGIFSGGGDAFDGMELCVTMLKHFCEWAKMQYVGTVAVPNCTVPEEIPNVDAIKNNIDNLIANLL